MRTYQLANSGLEISRIGYGCMTIGGGWGSEPLSDDTRAAAARAVLTAVEEGINLFDHADIYGRGKSELVFGEVLRQNPGLRQRMIIQSKCGIRFENDPQPGAPPRYDFSAEHILRSVDGILQRLAIDELDILLLHRPDPLVEPEEVARAFETLHESGKVRYFGVSNHTAAQLALLQSALSRPLLANQMELNLLHNHLINDGAVTNRLDVQYAASGGTLEYCRLHKILLQAWAPLAGGRLSNPPEHAPPNVQAAAALVEQMAADKQTSREAIILAWLLRHPAGIQPIIGTTRPERIKACAEADRIELSREEWYALFIAARGGPLP